MKKHEELSSTFTGLSNKFEAVVKEKMLMKLEKDRLIAKVENLELSMTLGARSICGVSNIEYHYLS